MSLSEELVTKDDIGNVKDEIRKVIMWMAGLLIGQVAVYTAILALFLG